MVKAIAVGHWLRLFVIMPMLLQKNLLMKKKSFLLVKVNFLQTNFLQKLRKTVSQKSEVSIDEPLNTDWDGNELLLCDVLSSDNDEVQKGIEEEEERLMIYRAIDRLSSRDREIICTRFGLCGKKEMTQKELADSMGISQSYISRLEKRIINQLKKLGSSCDWSREDGGHKLRDRS